MRRQFRVAVPVLLLSAASCGESARQFGVGNGGNQGTGGGSSSGGSSGGKAAGGARNTGGNSSAGDAGLGGDSSAGDTGTGGSAGDTGTGGNTSAGDTGTGGEVAGGAGGDSSTGGTTSTGGAGGTGGTSSGGTGGGTCAVGTQDNDKNGTCLPTCATAALPCAVHSACSDASGTAKCVCVSGYVGAAGACAWGTVPADPGFQNKPVGSWTASSGATLTPTSLGLVDDGNVVFDRTTICTGNGAMTQAVTMPEFAQAETMQLEFSSQGTCTSSGGFCSLGKTNVFFNGGAISFTPPSNYSNQVRCLGARAFGVTAPLVVRHGSREYPCDASVSAYSVSVDHVQIKPNAACPRPSTIPNGDFEAATNWVGTGTTSALVAGAGVGASQAWRLATLAGSCVSVSMKGDYSFPMTNRAALSVSLNGTAGKNLVFGTAGGGATWAEYLGTGNAFVTQNVCIPQFAKGMVQAVELRTYNVLGGGCAAGDARSFTVDNMAFTTAAACPVDSSIVDPGFEISDAVIRYWGLSVSLNGTAAGASGSIATDAVNAHGGSKVLTMSTQQACTSATASTVLSVPAPLAAAGPALKFFFKGGGANAAAVVTAGAASITVPAQATYAEQTLCLDPAAAGEGLPLMVRLSANGGTCATTFAATTGYFDDFRVTTDAACPIR
jgi:hypothetical protein